MSFSLLSKSSTPNSPDAKPGQPKEAEGPSVEKDTTQGSQTGLSGPAKPETEPASTANKSEPVVASASEKGEDASAPKPAPPTVSTPPASDASPGAPPAAESTDSRPIAISQETAATGAGLRGDSTPRSDQGPDPEKVREPEPTTTAGGPADPGTGETERRREFQRRRTLLIHTRLAKFFTWILLLAFVILPGTFSRVQANGTESESDGSAAGNLIDQIANLPLLAIGYVCCFANACAIGWLWYHRSDDPEWLFTNLFFAGFINAFSGLVTTFVNIYGAHDGQYGAASSSTLAVAGTCTFMYAVLTVVYYKKRMRYRYQRSRPNSSVA